MGQSHPLVGCGVIPISVQIRAKPKVAGTKASNMTPEPRDSIRIYSY